MVEVEIEENGSSDTYIYEHLKPKSTYPTPNIDHKKREVGLFCEASIYSPL